MELLIFSRAMYSTWIYYAPDRILFDCGEGISTTLTNKIFAIQKIFLTHGHADHISGLWGFINTRNSAMGEREKPLEIYYPKGSEVIKKYLDFIMGSSNTMKYDLSTHEIDQNFEMILSQGNSKRFIRTFQTKHINNKLTLGYHIVEQRKRLKPQYQNLDQSEIKKIALDKGRDEISELYEQRLVTISGDGKTISREHMENTDTLIHECTFLNGEEIKGENHTVLEELVQKVLEVKPKRLILYHISGRYTNVLKKNMRKLKEELSSAGISLEYVYPGKIGGF